MNKLLMIFLGLVLSKNSFALDLRPDCLFRAKNTFLCATEREKNEIAEKYKDVGYEKFIREIVADKWDVKVRPLTDVDESFVARTEYIHEEFAHETLKKLIPAWIGWFDVYCNASNGRLKELQLTEFKASRSFVCYSKSPLSPPLFGMVINDYLTSGDGHPRGHRVLHAYSPIGVKSLMGVLLGDIQIGDEAEQGMVIEIKPPLVKVQSEENGHVVEKWVKLELLKPKLVKTQ